MQDFRVDLLWTTTTAGFGRWKARSEIGCSWTASSAPLRIYPLRNHQRTRLGIDFLDHPDDDNLNGRILPGHAGNDYSQQCGQCQFHSSTISCKLRSSWIPP